MKAWSAHNAHKDLLPASSRSFSAPFLVYIPFRAAQSRLPDTNLDLTSMCSRPRAQGCARD